MASAWGRFRGRAVKALATVGALGLGSTVLVAVVVRRRLKAAASLPEGAFLLELDLEGTAVREVAHPRGLHALLASQAEQLPLHQAVEALRAAGSDERVKGLLALAGGELGLGLAQVQELRDAVIDFRQQALGRAPAVMYADAFGEGGAGATSAFYLASAFDVVAAQPGGLVSVTGVAAALPYARGLLDRWRVAPSFFAREEYKSAAAFLTGYSSTAPQREQVQATLGCVFSQVVEGIARERGLTEAQVRAAIDAAPHEASAAAALRLIDAPLYRDQVVKLTARLHEAAVQQPREMAGLWRGTLQRLLRDPDAEPAERLRRVPLAKYVAAQERERAAQEAQLQRKERLAGLVGGADSVGGAVSNALAAVWERGAALLGVQVEGKGEGRKSAEDGPAPAVALLTLTGPISLGPGARQPLGGAPSDKVASLPVVKALQAVRRDDAVRAVVLRIDSPGGSAVASEAIHREVSLLVAAGKPVVVSMGNVAASGGYYIAAPASKIVAQPGTITGSIGVVAGKLAVDGALRQQGVTVEVVQAGRNAAAQSPLAPFTRAQRRQVDELTGRVYALFQRRVAEGRGLSSEAVAAVAKGRVWTGQQAAALGLVDALGGLRLAVSMAKQEAGLPLDEGAVHIKHAYPDQRSELAAAVKKLLGNEEEWGGRDGQQAAAPAALAVLAAAAAAVGRPLTSGEAAVLQHLAGQLAGSGLAPQCVSLDAAMLAAAV